MQQQPIIYVVSDSVGETAEFVVKAASSQFGGFVEIRRVPYVTDGAVIRETVQSAKEGSALIAFTIVVPELRELLIEEATLNQVAYVDIMGPMMRGLSFLFQHDIPKNQPGLIHKLDDEYFRKVEAIEFAVKYDDGKDPRGLLLADVVLIGVSRTSKTPLSMYLAHKGYRVANVPLVPEVDPPEELYQVPRDRCIGLVIDPIQLNHIRIERLKALGLTADANYANLERIMMELEYAEKMIRRVGCPRLDVSNKAVEETANTIMDVLRKRDVPPLN